MSLLNKSNFHEQFHPCFRVVFAYFIYHGKSEDDANDLASAVIERALNRLHTYDPQKGSLTAWILAIARNQNINEWKRMKRTAHLPLDQVDKDAARRGDQRLPEEIALRTEEKKHLMTLLAGLEEREREMIALKFAGRMTNREIANLSGYSEGNVGVIVYRALRKLRAGLESPETEIQHGG